VVKSTYGLLDKQNDVNELGEVSQQVRVFASPGHRSRAKPIEDVFFQKSLTEFRHAKDRSRHTYSRSGAQGPLLMRIEHEASKLRSNDIKRTRATSLIERNFNPAPVIKNTYMKVA
jgi:hypothetical protein